MLARSLALPLLVFSFGCSLNPATNEPQLVLTTQAGEKEMGGKAAAQVDESIGTLSDPAITGYVRRVGDRVSGGAPEGQFDYDFRVLEMDEPNAFALPGGYVFISRGLLALTNSEDELAGILGHEVGHVAARHGASQASVQAPLRIATGIGAAATGIVSGTLGDYVAGVGGAATDALFSSYSRGQEREADELGQRFMATSGYDPVALASALDSLDHYTVLKGQSGGPAFFSSHPSTPERVAATRTRAQSLTVSPGAPTAGRATHVAHLGGLRMGPDPDQGVFVDEDFLHPGMNFAVAFPKGWKTVNARQYVGARADRGVVVVTLVEGTDPMTVARETEKRDGVDLKLRQDRVGGLPAVVGEAPASMEGRDAILDVAWIKHEGSVFQLFASSLVSDAEARKLGQGAIRSFRPLRAADRRRIRVPRLRIVPARAGETTGALAARTGSTWDGAELAVLNAVSVDEPLPAGRPMKIVREEAYTSGQATR